MSVKMTDSSKEFLNVNIELDGVDQDAVSVELAVVEAGTEVAESDWTEASWDPDVDGQARLLVGPGSAFGSLEVATYNVWARIAASIETPVRKAGTLRIVATS